jgi:hypothetical protein
MLRRIAMPNRSELIVLCGVAAVIACGSPSDGNFSDATGAGGQTATGGSSSGKGGSADMVGGSSGKGGSSGSSSGGKGGAGGTSGGATGATGGTTGGTGPDTGGTGTDTGGTGGGSETGGTTGTGGSTGGSGNETGGAGAVAGMGGSGALAGTGSETGGTTGGTGDTGGAGGTGGSSAGDGGSGGSSTNPDCAAHARAYDMALEAARACNAGSGKDQCTQTVPGDLQCGCAVYVNPDNEEAVAELQRLMKENPEDCIVFCPAIICVEPETATCVARSGGPSNGEDGTCGPMLSHQ